MTGLSKNTQCVLRILKEKESLSTSEILKLAKSPKFADICDDCAGGDTFITAANQLVEMGIVQKIFGKGGYSWKRINGDYHDS
jgi:hypothetical protein